MGRARWIFPFREDFIRSHYVGNNACKAASCTVVITTRRYVLLSPVFVRFFFFPFFLFSFICFRSHSPAFRHGRACPPIEIRYAVTRQTPNFAETNRRHVFTTRQRRDMSWGDVEKNEMRTYTIPPHVSHDMYAFATRTYALALVRAPFLGQIGRIRPGANETSRQTHHNTLGVLSYDGRLAGQEGRGGAWRHRVFIGRASKKKQKKQKHHSNTPEWSSSRLNRLFFFFHGYCFCRKTPTLPSARRRCRVDTCVQQVFCKSKRDAAVTTC